LAVDFALETFVTDRLWTDGKIESERNHNPARFICLFICRDSASFSELRSQFNDGSDIPRRYADTRRLRVRDRQLSDAWRNSSYHTCRPYWHP
jgi:hypothetical protein